MLVGTTGLPDGTAFGYGVGGVGALAGAGISFARGGVAHTPIDATAAAAAAAALAHSTPALL